MGNREGVRRSRASEYAEMLDEIALARIELAEEGRDRAAPVRAAVLDLVEQAIMTADDPAQGVRSDIARVERMAETGEADPDLADRAVYQMRLWAMRIGVRARRIGLEVGGGPEPRLAASSVGKL